MEPKISVIVPVYKVEEYLHRCVDSILSQSFTDFELILVDDGSPDNCGKICDEYAQKDSRVRVFHKPNGGVSSARNLGLDNAKGEWITFIDSDDYVEPGFLIIPSTIRGDLLIQNYKVLYDNGYTKKTEFINEFISETQILDYLGSHIVERIFRVPWAKFFKREIIVNNGIVFTEGIRIGEDTLFLLDYLCHIKSIQPLSTSSYIYRKENIDVVRKYALSARESVEIFRFLVLKYENLKIYSIDFLLFIFTLYYSLIYPQNYESLKYWSEDPIVKRIYKVIRTKMHIRWHIQYRLRPMLKILTCECWFLICF